MNPLTLLDQSALDIERYTQGPQLPAGDKRVLVAKLLGHGSSDARIHVSNIQRILYLFNIF
jgi:hypothetical protein